MLAEISYARCLYPMSEQTKKETNNGQERHQLQEKRFRACTDVSWLRSIEIQERKEVVMEFAALLFLILIIFG